MEESYKKTKKRKLYRQKEDLTQEKNSILYLRCQNQRTTVIH